MIEFTRTEVSAYYSTRVPRLKQTSTREWRGKCPAHDGDGDNFAVQSETGLATCFSQCARGWDVIGLEMELSSADFPRAKTEVFRIVGRPEIPMEDRDAEAIYNYTDEQGVLRYQVVRKFGKQFRQRRPGPDGRWIWDLKGIEPVPFNLPKVVAAKFVGIAEGERDVQTLERLGIVGTCNNGGALHFRPELASWFAGKRIAIFPDNDEKGRAHAVQVAGILRPVAAELRIIELPGLSDKGDVTDWRAAGGTVDQLRELYRTATEWTPEWKFAALAEPESPPPQYIHRFKAEVIVAGGMDGFWNLPEQDGIPTPWRALTKALAGGMRDGEVYVIGANQGAGKTSLAMQFVIHAIRRRVGVLYFSMEMQARDIFQRMASIEARVDLLEFRDKQRATMCIDLRAMREALTAATQNLIQYPLIVSTKPSVTPEYLLAECIRIRKEEPIRLVVIDHMQLMGSTGQPRSDYEKFTAISRMTKQVAVELGLPVMLISQTSRSNAADKRTELEVSDLRGTGAIEEDAGAVMLLYQDKEDRDRTMQDQTFAKGPVKTWLKLGKNRYGLQGLYLPLLHFKTCTRFDEYEPELAERSVAN